MLVKMHPDVARLVWKFKRWHHFVDYTPFKDLGLLRKPDLQLPTDSVYRMEKVVRPKRKKD
jgi:hypothetical protein